MRENCLPNVHTHHKKEMNARITADAKDRKSLQDKLGLCIDPLETDSHPEGLVNILLQGK